MSRPDIVLVVVDSLRADHVHGDAAETPAMDGLAGEPGTVDYRRAFAQGPFTTFSMPSLFTSRYPSELDYVELSESIVGVDVGQRPTLAGRLRAAGYRTVGLHSNPLLSELLGVDRGFDSFDARLPFSGTDRLPGRAKVLTDKLLRLVRRHPYLPARRLTERALSWLDDRDDDRPVFLWLHYMDVHGPYQAKSGNAYLNKFRAERLWRRAVDDPAAVTDDRRRRLLELYREEVEYTDRWIGRLFEGLRERGRYGDALVALTADHGEAFGERGRYSHPHHPHDELAHVPLLVRDPTGAGGRNDDVVELLDLAPTVFARAGLEIPDGFAGETLPAPGGDGTPDSAPGPGSPSADADADADPAAGDERPGGTVAVGRAAVTEADLVPEYVGSLRTARWRYVRGRPGTDDPESPASGREDADAGNAAGPVERLYDLEADPGATTDCGAEHPAVRDALAAELDRRVGRPDATGADTGERTIEDGDVERRLRDLGYLD